ncbi:MAG: hypothetical protein GDA49_13830 [Rhodospirillales bacterium]|nr:hypothetical protein [Rhodospirillales bacterium]
MAEQGFDAVRNTNGELMSLLKAKISQELGLDEVIKASSGHTSTSTTT